MKKIKSTLEKLLFSAQAQKSTGFTEHQPLSKSKKPIKSKVKPSENKIFTDNDQSSEKKHIKEIGGPKGPEPTRYGDWERDGRCVDF
tara:strand:+ start:270 stop:530 length:261 start_codon:yes stop_codon:yes gene_type:complete